MMYAIETRKLTKNYNGVNAVDGLSLKVPEGSVYGFLGPNGAGKTTTIRMLTGLCSKTSGDILICGREVAFGSLRNRTDIGFLTDVPCFYDWMTPAEYLRFSGELFSLDRKVIDRRAESLLELVGLGGVKKKIGGFSRGMKQRLGIAQAMISEPRVIFLDEPTSALDPIGRKEVMDIIGRLAGKVTVFFSTHILSDAERVCDRVVILDKGRVLVEDSMENLKKTYSSRVIAMEVEDGDPSGLLECLDAQDWVEAVKSGGNNEILLYVRDITAAQLRIPGILDEKGLPLRKFSILEPDLEGIFMKVVGE